MSQSEKNLVLSFSSIHVDSDPTHEREIEYQVCYEQLLKVLPDNFDVIFLDNTIDSLDSLDRPPQKLKSLLTNQETLCYNHNVGSEGNKGMGELEMLIRAFDEYDLDEYSKVCYLTGRRIITCPYVFDKTNALQKDALISNPPLFEVMSGHEQPVNYELYNDMFFAMKIETMKKYVEHSKNNLNNMAENRIGSEQNLFHFINENKISHEWLDHLGFIRNDWEGVNPMFYSRNKENMQWI